MDCIKGSRGLPLLIYSLISLQETPICFGQWDASRPELRKGFKWTCPRATCVCSMRMYLGKPASPEEETMELDRPTRQGPRVKTGKPDAHGQGSRGQSSFHPQRIQHRHSTWNRQYLQKWLQCTEHMLKERVIIILTFKSCCEE